MNYWIAIVDDDPMILTSVSKMLTAQGMKVSCLRSGNYFLKFIEHNTPDLILLDIMMTEMNGFETFRRLREFEEQSGRKHIPVIFLSGENDSETENEGLKIGAADYIRKPVEPAVLLRRIQNAVSNNRMIENLTKEAEHDKLTGFLNKASGTRKITELCSSKIGVLLVMDIDSFKLVNDLYGHEMGDKVLISFADIVRKNTRADDVVSRVGGDEFLAFLPDIKEEKTASAIIKRLNDQFVAKTKSLMGENHDIPIGISVGGALAPVHSVNFEILFQYADQTMYKVKKNGKHGFAMYDSVSNETDDSVSLESEISRVSQILGERSEGNGAMLLGQDSFSWNYRFVMRFIKRYRGEATKIIFAVSSKDSTADMTKITEEYNVP